MIEWRIAAILIVVVLIGFAYPWIKHVIDSWLWMRRMKAEGRWIPVDEAKRECEQGLGTLIHNERDELPFEWWYLRNADRILDQDRIVNLKDHGYIVEFENQKQRDDLAHFKFQFEELVPKAES